MVLSLTHGVGKHGPEQKNEWKENTERESCQNGMFRSLVNIRQRDRFKNTFIEWKFRNVVNFVNEFERKKWDWAGHVVRIMDNKGTYKIKSCYIINNGEKVDSF